MQNEFDSILNEVQTEVQSKQTNTKFKADKLNSFQINCCQDVFKYFLNVERNHGVIQFRGYK